MPVIAALCILHGDPVCPEWLTHLSAEIPVTIIVNDMAPGRYLALPPHATTLINEGPRGFAHNVNAGLLSIDSAFDPDYYLVLNFDLDVRVDDLLRLCNVLVTVPDAAAISPYMNDASGKPVLSVGHLPRPLQELTRAAGLRQGALHRAQRRLLRRSPAWSRRNLSYSAHPRLLTPEEYLPWTCIALRRAAWIEVGPLDERFYLYAEDIDWGIRAQRAGWRLAVVSPVAAVVHHERATQSPRTDTLYELSHHTLHLKYGWETNRRCQQAGLRLRQLPLVRNVLPPLDAELLDACW